jgi:hypothetical protein
VRPACADVLNLLSARSENRERGRPCPRRARHPGSRRPP